MPSSAGPSGMISTNICALSSSVSGCLSWISTPSIPTSASVQITISSASVFVLSVKRFHFIFLYLLMLYTHLRIFVPVCRLFSVVPKTGTSFNIHEYRKKRKRLFMPLSCFMFIYSSNISLTFSRKPFFFFSVFSDFSEVSAVLSAAGRLPHAASKASRAFFASSLRLVGVWTTSVT